MHSPWFTVELTEEVAPWAFCKGLPYKAISALELLGTVMAVMILGDFPEEFGGVHGAVRIRGFTDSQVSSQVVTRGMTTSFPLCCVTMDLAAKLEEAGARLDLEWVPRTANVEADALSNFDTSGFDLGLRREVQWDSPKWARLRRLFEEGADFFLARQASRKQCGEPPTQPPKKRARDGGLRVREPW